MEKITKEHSYQFYLLYIIGIYCVVAGHPAGIPMFFGTYFHYYSWHMPFLIFISGYFFNFRGNIKDYFIKQFKKLIILYYLWNFCFWFGATTGLFSFGGEGID